MKKIYFLVVMMSLFMTGKLMAQSTFYEDFTGLNIGASLVNQNAWTKGGSGPEITVANTTPLVYLGYNGGGGEYAQIPTGSSTTSRNYKTFSNAGILSSTTTFYFSVLLKLSAATTTGDYFLTLADGGAGTNFFGKLFVKQ
jgi:hypothetical protein